MLPGLCSGETLSLPTRRSGDKLPDGGVGGRGVRGVIGCKRGTASGFIGPVVPCFSDDKSKDISGLKEALWFCCCNFVWCRGCKLGLLVSVDPLAFRKCGLCGDRLPLGGPPAQAPGFVWGVDVGREERGDEIWMLAGWKPLERIAG